ncbi:CHAT domain-containing protein [Limnofasciculus baicalensis]|uniref:CHAT domain-containing protein n=1 Tax=Limnofasciculus baicalensis BBK-W-15 TaxID=2699891 RepID=A0AAE3GR15_9CYAN|nr:CHAT domain-containing protein [Limnofasciculus baicalensis]MCP2726937.1 CHAT domain-containing protein [Limnofasciculus baicalensis BBK-W-15]
MTKVVPAIAYQQTPAPTPNQEPKQEEIVQPPSAPEQLLQQGKELYKTGQFFAAANLWQQAAQSYGEEGAILNQAQALNYLSLAYQELGQWSEAKTTIETSLKLLQSFDKLEVRGMAILAQALNTKGSLEIARGETETALETWKQAEATYNRAGNEIGKLGSKINQAQAFQALGQYRRSKTILEQLVGELQSQPDSLLKVDGLRSLGVALQTIGDLDQSKEILEQSWAISQELNANTDTSATIFSIGNIARDLQKYDVAFAYYQEAAKRAEDGILKIQINLNQLSLLAATNQEEAALDLVPDIESALSSLSPSRSAIYARVNLAESMMKMGNGTGDIRMGNGQEDLSIINPQKVAELLATAVQQARQLNDKRAEAYSLNQLGKLYKQTKQWDNAKDLTEEALEIAQQLNAADISARAAWQLGRILKEQGDINGAIAAYGNSINNLQSLRSDLVAINPEIQFNFKENVEPIYREFVSLLLQPDANQDALNKARQTIEALQLAELDNFFKDACLDTKPVQIDDIDVKAAVIYPIILSDRLEVVFSLPKQPLRHYSTQLSAQKVEKILQKLYSSLYPGYSNEERLKLSQEVYDWLIRPAQADLQKNNISTVVFVPDGFLRSLPMAALYDGENYLIEKYSIALSSGLQLFPQALERQQLNVLAVGLTEARPGFSALPGVEAEVKQIAADLNSEVLLDRKFTREAFQTEVNSESFRVVHLATHGQFSSNPEETFLLTWDGQLNIQDFDVLFQKRRVGLLKPIELLVLSACQTASGDKRATLGLAGLALRSGAYSTLASLWSVNDQSTSVLMSDFYRQLTQSKSPITKAESLRQAQLTMLKNPKYNHPYFWASFILIGNWL